MGFVVLVILSLVVSSVGWHKFVWFISLGYGFSVAAIGVALLVMYGAGANPVSIVQAVLFVVYGLRLGGYLLARERRSAAYNKLMKDQVNDGSGLGKPVQAVVWASVAVLYACEASPVLFRMQAGAAADVACVIGAVLQLGGIVLESAADLQKSAQKKVNPRRFCDKGLYSFVRCPNYLGEVITWTGAFVSGITIYSGPLQWVVALAGYVCIVYIMFGGARRLEIRQNKNYGTDPEYQAYVKSVPILIPFIPLYSVEKYKWLVS